MIQTIGAIFCKSVSVLDLLLPLSFIVVFDYIIKHCLKNIDRCALISVGKTETAGHPKSILMRCNKKYFFALFRFFSMIFTIKNKNSKLVNNNLFATVANSTDFSIKVK